MQLPIRTFWILSDWGEPVKIELEKTQVKGNMDIWWTFGGEEWFEVGFNAFDTEEELVRHFLGILIEKVLAFPEEQKEDIFRGIRSVINGGL